MNISVESLFGGLFDKPKPKDKPPRPNLPPDYEEALKSHVDKLISDNNVVVFTTTTCPWCKVTEQSLETMNVEYKKVNLNTYTAAENDVTILGPLMHKYVVEMTGLKTVPNIVVKNDMIGGNSSLTAKMESGELKQIFDKYQIVHSLA